MLETFCRLFLLLNYLAGNSFCNKIFDNSVMHVSHDCWLLLVEV